MALLLLIAAAVAVGRVFGRLLPLGEGVEGWFVRTVLGLAVCAALALWVGLHSLLAAQAALLCLVLAGVMAEGMAWTYTRPARRRSAAAKAGAEGAGEREARPAGIPWFDALLLCLAGTALVTAFFGAWAPLSDGRAAAGVMALAKEYARAGSLGFTENAPDSGAPHLMRTLHALVWSGSGERAATLLSWSAGLLACMGVFLAGRRTAGPRAGAAAAAVFASMPVFYDQASTASLEMGSALFAAAAFLVFLAWTEHREPAQALAAGLLAGAAWGCSHACAPLAALLPLVMVFSGRPEHPEDEGTLARSVCLVLAGGLAGAAPFLARTWLVTGDPVYPYLQALFPGRTDGHLPVAWLAADPEAARRGLSPAGLLRYPWDVLMRPALHGGWSESPGGLLAALALPGLLFGGRRARLAAVLAASGGALLWWFDRGSLPVLAWCAPAAVLAGAGAASMPALRRATAAALVAGCLFGLGLQGARLWDQLPVLAGRETREAYLARRVPRFPLWQAVDAKMSAAPEGARVLSLDGGGYFSSADTHTNLEGLAAKSLLEGGARWEWLGERGIVLLAVPEDMMTPDSPLPEPAREVLTRWLDEPSLFPLADTVDVPRLAGEGVEKVRLYAVARNP